MTLFAWLNWTVNNSAQAAEDKRWWQTDGLCTDCRTAKLNCCITATCFYFV